MFVFFPLSHFLLLYLQVEQAVLTAGGAGNITAEDRSVDDDVQPTAKAKAKSQSQKDEDLIAKIQADLELTKSLYRKADAESVVAEQNKDNPVVNYIQYIKSHFMKASESEFAEFRNQTNSLISKHEFNRAMATQPAAQPATQPHFIPGASYQREQQQHYRPRQYTQQQTESTQQDELYYNFPRPPSAPPIMSRKAPSTATSSSMYSSSEHWQPPPNTWSQRPALGGDVFSSMNKQYMHDYMQQPIIQPFQQPVKPTYTTLQPAVTTSESLPSTSFGSTVSDQEATVPLTAADIVSTLTEMADIVNTSLLSTSQMDTSTSTTHSNSENTPLEREPEHSTPK